MKHQARITKAGRYGAWVDCSCDWSSPWYSDHTQARAARNAHYLTALDPDVARQHALRGRSFPDPREQLIDRCTCGGWRWNSQCRNDVCWTNLNHAKENAA